MSFLKFEPEVARLRRIGKACAAGEVSRVAYRQARRRVIDALVQSEASDLESTVQRKNEGQQEREQDRDVTRRRQYGSVSVVEVEKHSETRTWVLLACAIALMLLLPIMTLVSSSRQEQAAVDMSPVVTQNDRTDIRE